MKLPRNFKTIFKTLIAVVTVSVVFAACSKDRIEPQQVAGLSIIMAYPDTTTLDFIIDQTLAQEARALNYNAKVDYLNLFPGTRRFGVTKENSNRLIMSENFNLKSGVGYSVFVIDTVKENTKKFLLTEDDLTAPAADKAKVRFINLSKDGGSLSLGIHGVETDLFTNKAFYEYTTFADVNPGESITFDIKENAAVKTTLPNVKIEKGKIYTIYAKGLQAAAIDSLKLGAAIYTHK